MSSPEDEMQARYDAYMEAEYDKYMQAEYEKALEAQRPVPDPH